MTRRYRCGLASLQEVDRTVGHLYREFERLGELWKTVFIFYTDNGVFFGEHRIGGGKLYPYEEADRTPLYIRLPPAYREQRVPQVTQPVANIDLAPTILRLAHARPCRARGHCRVMDGRSLLPLLRGKVPSLGRAAPARSRARHRVRKPKARCLQVRGRADTRGACSSGTRGSPREAAAAASKDVQRERYDLRRDPYQLHNLCFGGRGCPKDSEQRRLRRLLARIRHCSGIRGRDPRAKGRSYCG